MDLDEYLWKTKTKMKDLARKTGYSTASIYLIRNRKNTPNLMNALRLYDATDGMVTLEEMVRKEDLEELKTLKLPNQPDPEEDKT